MATRNMRDHYETLEEISLRRCLSVDEFNRWCNRENRDRFRERYLDIPFPGELSEMTDEEFGEYLCPTLLLEDDLF